MIRKPLRPLTKVLEARRRGVNPALDEAEARAERMYQQRTRERRRAESRLLFLGCLFALAFVTVGVKMSVIASTDPVEPNGEYAPATILAQRADIVDRNGSVLATNMITQALYAQPHIMVDPMAAARGLTRIFPDLSEEVLGKSFTGKRKFLWIKKNISPEQRQMVHDLGEPGLLFGPREMRLYPNGKIASHILGGAGYGREGVHAAEVTGVAGVEEAYDAILRDPIYSEKPLKLSLDLTVQAAMEEELARGMARMNAKGASAVLMEAKTGKIISMVSLPDFDPNFRPRPLIKGEGNQADSPLFNRAAQGTYELGSTFKIFTAALAMERGVANPNTLISTKGPLKWGKFTIKDYRDHGPNLSLTNVIVKSSNIGTARLALQTGTKNQQKFMRKLGFFDRLPVEVIEASGSKPILPKRWSELSTMTISYGHGIAATPLHLASAYASLVNGGLVVKPTILMDAKLPTESDRIISEATSSHLRKMLRAVVTRGTASFGNVPGYEVGGKTGTADKPNPNGGYYKEKVIATFASIFPSSDPQYVMVVTLDEPVDRTGPKPRRTAGWTSVKVAANAIKRVAPLLGLRPDYKPTPKKRGVTLAGN